MVHESNSIPARRLVTWDIITQLLEPFNLVSSDAVHPSQSHTVGSSCSKEKHTRPNIILVIRGLNWEHEGELMFQIFAIPFEVICQRHVILIRVFPCFFNHAEGIHISFKVMVPCDESKRYLLSLNVFE